MSKTKKSKIYLANFDEPYIWLTGLGLTLGLFMVVSLLGLIFYNGLGVFWPKDIHQIEMKNASREIWLGEYVKEKTKSFITDPSNTLERQIFTGNKERFGQMFKYLDLVDVEKDSIPQNAMRVERLEFGPAIGFPVSLELSGGKTIDANDAVFFQTLHQLIEDNLERIKKINHIEKSEIGKINEKMEDLRLKVKIFNEKLSILSPNNNPEIQILNTKIAQANEKTSGLQDQYNVLAAKARDLRAKATENKLNLKTGNAEIFSLPIGQVLAVDMPNQMNVFSKSVLAVTHLVKFIKDEPREANTEGGIFPALFGTFVMTLLMSIAVMPFGVVAAIYLREYAKQGVWVRSIRIAVNNLAGVPSIVFGVFGLGFFVYVLGKNIDLLLFADKLPTPTFGTGGVLWAAMTLALMTVPVVIVATEEALASVPRGAREAALALGSSKWQSIQSVVLPAAAPGILTGLILAMARGAGEVAPLMLVGVVKLAPTLPLDATFPFFHLDRKFMHLGFHIYDLGFQSPDSEAAKPMVFATTLLLIGLVVSLNAGAILIRNYLRKKYATSAF